MTILTHKLEQIFRGIQADHRAVGVTPPTTRQLIDALQDLGRQAYANNVGAALEREELVLELATKMRILLRKRVAESTRNTGSGAGRGQPHTPPRVAPATAQALACLGLPPTASLSDASAAFAKLKREYHLAMRRSHPDVSSCHHSVAAQINEAHEAHRKAWNLLRSTLT
jgi:hypothetical protein